MMWAFPPNGNHKVGIDDFLFAHGSSGAIELAELIDHAEHPRSLSESDSPMAAAKWLLAEEYSNRDGASLLRWWRDEFWAWRGTHYAKIEKSEFQARILRWLDDNNLQAKPRFAKDVVECIAALCIVPFQDEQPIILLNADQRKPDFKAENIIAFQNGLLNIIKVGGQMVLHPHTPRWFSGNVLSFDFDPPANCPSWLEFLAQTLGDDELIDLLQRFMGLLLTSDTSYQKILLMVGPPRSGKGTICRVIQCVIGEHACTSPSLSSLASDFGLWPLCEKTVVICPDAHLGRNTDTTRVLEMIKAISGEDRLNINRKYLPAIQNIRLRTRFVISVNELPHFNDSSGALASRLLVLPFKRSFEGCENRDLEKLLNGEASGIANWCLGGLLRLRQQGGFNKPVASQEIINSYRHLVSPIFTFLEEICEVGLGKRVSCSALFKAYCQWSQSNGQRPVTAHQLGAQLRAACPEVVRRRIRDGAGRPHVYDGIELISPEATIFEHPLPSPPPGNQ